MNPLETSLNDYERVAQLKAWFKAYGNWLVGGLVAVLLAIILWQYWQHQQIKNSEQASLIYAQLMTSVSSSNVANTDAAANELIKNYSATPYAKIAAFVLAKRNVQDNKLAEAAEQLRWVIKHKQQPLLSQLAQIRLARVLIAQNQPQQALDVLAGAEQIYPAETSLVRSNALLALGKKPEALAEMQKAMQALPSDSPLQSMLEMHLSNI